MKFPKLTTCLLCLASLVALSGCRHHKVSNPVAQVDSKQPDKVLFDRAENAIQHSRYDEARTLLQTLINTYPDSEFIARAKLAIADSWYDEGTSAGYQQAEREYNDFITFFPQMADAAEAQMKIANIHYMQMEKPDRDYTHALRAEDEYRKLIEQYPDSKLVPQAKQKLRDVQEVLAEREFSIGHFYFLRESWTAAIARLKTVADTYPLYSQADEALFLLGQANEQEASNVKAAKLPDATQRARQERLASDFRQDAINAYDRIIERYPAGQRANDAKQRLEAMHAPIPTPTPEAIAQNKAEIASRGDTSVKQRIFLNFKRQPDLSAAAHVGDPTMQDPQQSSAPAIAQHATKVLLGQDTPEQKVSGEIGGTGTAPITHETAPRSDAPDTTTPAPANAAPAATSAPASFEAVPENPNINTSSNTSTVTGTVATPATSAPANSAPSSQSNDSGMTTIPSTSTATGTAAPAGDAPQQTQPQAGTPTGTSAGDAAQQASPATTSNSASPSTGSATTTAQPSSSSKDDSSSSKTKKKKHGLGKLNPF